MEAEKEEARAPAAGGGGTSATSCRKKKSDDASFLEDLRDHVDEFIHASMDEHKTCFQKTIRKVGDGNFCSLTHFLAAIGTRS